MNEPHETHVTAPSVWPATLAGGVTMLLFGVVASPAISVVGAALMIWATAGWIGELRRG